MSSIRDISTQVSVCIVNYNAGNHLINCVESVITAGINQIIVVDNGSTDGSIGALQNKNLVIKLIRLPNPGYGAAMNVAVSVAETPYIFCINPDTVILPNSIEKLLAKMLDDQKIALVGPKIVNQFGEVYPSARSFPSPIDAVGHAIVGFFKPNNPWSDRYKTLNKDYSISRQVDWVSGSAMFMKREAFNSIQGFDERYFMYMEDVDLAWRLNQHGWKVFFEPNSQIVHHQGISTSRVPYKMIIAHHKSLLIYTRTTITGRQRLLLPFIMLGIVVRIPVACLAWKFKKSKN